MEVKQLLKNVEEILCGGFLITMIVIVIVNVFLRYFSNYSLYWAEEVATICFVWAVFLGASATYKHKMDIGIDILVKKTKIATQKKINIFVKALLLLLNGYIFYISIVFTVIAFEKPTAVLGISSAIINSALIASFAFITWHTFWFLIKDIKTLFSTSAKNLG